MKAKDLFLLVSTKLQDIEPGMDKRWPWEKDPAASRASLVDFLNAAIRQTVLSRPDITAKTQSVQLAQGVRQTIPSDGVFLLSVARNMGTNGSTPGKPIFATGKDSLAAYSWTYAGSEIDFYYYDPLVDKKTYYTLPGVGTTTRWIEISYSVNAGTVATANDDIPIPEMYSDALEHMMLYHILSGDSSASNLALAKSHYDAFYMAVGADVSAITAARRMAEPQS